MSEADLSTNISDISEHIQTSLPFTSNAMKVLKARYLIHDEAGNCIETPEQMFHRVAASLASKEKENEKWTGRFEEVMKKFEFIPAGRTLANAGAATDLVANCVVLHMEDDLGSIFETLKEAALLQQGGSGIGFPFHLLRPAGMKCKRTLGVSSGPMSFLRIFAESFRIIQQHGRHGANMAIMRIDHPDILEFIEAKKKEGKFENFNFSIGITDEFMKKVIEKDETAWMCEWKGEKMLPRYITRDEKGLISDISEARITAGELMEEIVHCAWSNGEPGCVFIDTVNESNPLPGLGRIECCNPCGEQYLHSGDACNLGSINLEKFVKSGENNEALQTPQNANENHENHENTKNHNEHNGNNEIGDAEERIDWEKLKRVTAIGVRMLDNVVDLTRFPVKRVQEMFEGNRRIGLGIMGLADMLFELKVGYNTEKGRSIAAKVMKCIQETAIETSIGLGKEKGNFKNFGKSKWIWTEKTMRNASLTNVAPTGSTALLLDVSSGVEPYFALAYRRGNCLAGKMEPFVNKHLKKALIEAGCYSEEIMSHILEKGTLKDILEIPETIRKVFVTSLDISAEDHIKMQAAVQKYCCNAISKTINFGKEAKEEEVREGFLTAWKEGIKGLTVYRNGSREIQVLDLNTKKEKGEAVRTFTDTCRDGNCDI